MIKKINKTKYIIEVGDITKVSTDVLFTWTVGKLNQGDLVWKAIHRAAGSVLYQEGLAALTQYGYKDINGETFLPASRCVITKGGFLDVYYIIHCVLPNKRVKEERKVREMLFNRTLNNAIMLTDALKIDIPIYKLVFHPISENIYGEVTKEDIQKFWENIFTFKDYKEIKIICNNKEEYKMYSSILEKLTTSKWERIINKIFKNKF